MYRVVTYGEDKPVTGPLTMDGALEYARLLLARVRVLNL